MSVDVAVAPPTCDEATPRQGFGGGASCPDNIVKKIVGIT